MEPLHKAFTYAITTDEQGPLTLIFAALDGDQSIWSTETMLRIANDLLFNKMMAKGAAIIPVDEIEKIPQLIASTDVREYAVNRLEHARRDDSIILCDPENGIQTLNLQGVYDRCTLPHKTIMGCASCKAKLGTCDIKKLELAYCGDEDAWDPEDAKEKLKNRKDKIAGFTFISPRLTAPEIGWGSARIEDAGRNFRTVSQHDFEMIDDNSATVSKGLKERARVKRFKKNACTQCFVTEECWRYLSCSSNYPDNEKAAATTILQHVNIPFTDKQLLYLALNSGKLEKRFNRCKYWVTFRMKGPTYETLPTLEFGLVRQSKDSFELFDTFRKAKQFIRQYSAEYEISKYHRPLSDLAKAVLVELATKDSSPRYCAPLHGYTSYGTIGLTYLAGYQNFSMYFRDTRGGLHHDSLDAGSLREVYRKYGLFSYLQAVKHPDGYSYRP